MNLDFVLSRNSGATSWLALSHATVPISVAKPKKRRLGRQAYTREREVQRPETATSARPLKMSGAAFIQKPQVYDRAIVHAYRHLYRAGLKVVNYSTPSRHVLLRILRSSFRSSPALNFNPQKVFNTLQFLQRAADVAGLEHRIVKNLMMVRYWEQPHLRKDLRM